MKPEQKLNGDEVIDMSKYWQEQMDQAGINWQTYEKYFNIINKIDQPFKQALPDFEQISQGNITPRESMEFWNQIKQTYDTMDQAKIATVPGLEVLLEIKPLVDKFDALFRAYADEFEKTPGLAPYPELVELKQTMLTLCEKVKDCKAYIAYRARTEKSRKF